MISKARFGRRARQAFSVAGLAGSVLRRSLTQRFPAVGLKERLATLPAHAPSAAPLAIRWNDNHVPFVRAGSERDAAVGLGIVHGHLRLAQMEVMRRAALGRVAEIVGDAAVELDRLLRLVDFPRATEGSLAMMPPETRAWVDGFADGINAAAEARLPPEFETLAIRFEPWTAEELFAVSRLCSADYAWKVWRTLNPLREDPEWANLWADLVGVAAVADEDIPFGADQLDEAMPTLFSRTGSNCYALAGSRTASGVPILACDPHHIITAPNLWLVAGFETPDLKVWGFMIPALPIFGVGRNQHGAWGGTNLHATSSELVDLTDEEVSVVEAKVSNGRKARTLKLRQSRFGPVISDAKPFKMPKDTVALHWLGHQPSDEYTPFRQMMHARDWQTFADAVDGYALPGLNMVWADKAGHIGKMVAAHIPSRPLATPQDLVISPDEAHQQWSDFLSAKQLPMEVDPDEGFVVSANEAPKDPPVTISLFFAAPYRYNRIASVLSERDDVTVADVRALQADVYLAPAERIAQRMSELAKARGLDGAVIAALAAWDGHYRADSAGALAFETIAEPLIKTLEERSPKRFVSPYWRPFSRLSLLVDGTSDEELSDAMKTVLGSADAAFARHRTWGGMHKVRLTHPLSKLPWLARRLPTIEFPSGGSNDTVMKSMHPFTQKRHATNFGANARFIADLAGEDETFAVLLGGQDGWPGSDTMFDMVGAWRRSELVRLPFTPAALDEAFPHVSEIAAAPAPAAVA